MSETPRTDAVVGQREYGSLADSEYVRLSRQLERELNEAKEEIKWLKRELDAIEPSRVQWKAMAQELATELEKAAKRYRLMFATDVAGLLTEKTPHDNTLSRFNSMNKCHHGIRDTATNLPYCRKCDEEGLK